MGEISNLGELFLFKQNYGRPGYFYEQDANLFEAQTVIVGILHSFWDDFCDKEKGKTASPS